MKAVICQKALPIENKDSLKDIETPVPTAKDYDLLVEVKAVSVNPIDCKIRALTDLEGEEYRVLGWDAAGIVKAVGNKVSLFKPGDQVWYAGDLTRPGCNSEYHLVDERIVGYKPKKLSFEEAASLPLTTLTSWELLFDRLAITSKERGTILITGAAGGVGSILVQLVKKLTSLTVIATASREASKEWVKGKGVDHIIDHSEPLQQQLIDLNLGPVDYVASLVHSREHAEELIDCIKPQGKFALIDDSEGIDLRLFQLKSLSIYWEMVFTRALFKTPDLIRQHDILNEAAKLVDKGVLNATLNEHFGIINAQNLRRAHTLIESDQSRGKIVLSGF